MHDGVEKNSKYVQDKLPQYMVKLCHKNCQLVKNIHFGRLYYSRSMDPLCCWYNLHKSVTPTFYCFRCLWKKTKGIRLSNCSSILMQPQETLKRYTACMDRFFTSKTYLNRDDPELCNKLISK